MDLVDIPLLSVSALSLDGSIPDRENRLPNRQQFHLPILRFSERRKRSPKSISYVLKVPLRDLGGARFGKSAFLEWTVFSPQFHLTKDSAVKESTNVPHQIEFKNVSYTYRGTTRPAIHGISFNFDSSQPLAIVGKNGSGKSTLIKILIQQNIGFSGSYGIDGTLHRDPHGDILSLYNWGYLPEDMQLEDRLTGYETAHLIGELRGMSATDLANEITDLKRRLRIDSWFEEKECREYSAGMKRKVGLLIAFLGDRRLVILDEPTNFLDALTVLELKSLIREKISAGVSIVVSSHMIDFIASLIDQIMVINDGSLQYFGSLNTLQNESPEQSLDELFIDLLTRSGASTHA